MPDDTPAARCPVCGGEGRIAATFKLTYRGQGPQMLQSDTTWAWAGVDDETRTAELETALREVYEAVNRAYTAVTVQSTVRPRHDTFLPALEQAWLKLRAVLKVDDAQQEGEP